MNKYPPLEEPCLSCQYKCFRVEDMSFISDKNCKYFLKNIMRTQREFSENWEQESIWKIK